MGYPRLSAYSAPGVLAGGFAITTGRLTCRRVSVLNFVSRLGLVGAGAGIQDALPGDAGGRAAVGCLQEHEDWELIPGLKRLRVLSGRTVLAVVFGGNCLAGSAGVRGDSAGKSFLESKGLQVR